MMQSIKILPQGLGSSKGTDLKDICNLVGGMDAGRR